MNEVAEIYYISYIFSQFSININIIQIYSIYTTSPLHNIILLLDINELSIKGSLPLLIPASQPTTLVNSSFILSLISYINKINKIITLIGIFISNGYTSSPVGVNSFK